MSDPDEAEQFAMQIDDECVELDARDRVALNHESAARLIRERDILVARQAAEKERARCVAVCKEVEASHREDIQKWRLSGDSTGAALAGTRMHEAHLLAAAIESLPVEGQ